MNSRELEITLQKIGVPHEYYSILQGGLPNEKLCLINSEGTWEVFYSERGIKSGTRIFTDEESACAYFFEKIKIYAVN